MVSTMILLLLELCAIFQAAFLYTGSFVQLRMDTKLRVH